MSALSPGDIIAGVACVATIGFGWLAQRRTSRKDRADALEKAIAQAIANQRLKDLEDQQRPRGHHESSEDE